MQANIHEAKTHFSKLIERALAGKEVVIAKAGKPLVKLVPLAPTKPKRIFSMDKGKFRVPDGFDDPDPGIEAMFS